MNIQLFKKGFMLFLLVLVCNTAQAVTNFSGLYVFGDSLTDTGNVYVLTGTTGFRIPPNTRYYQGRFSNGPNAPDLLWRSMGHSSQVKPFMAIPLRDLKITGKEALSFSFGGSTSGFFNSVLGQFYVPGLLGQVGVFNTIKSGSKVLKGSAALIWAGGNDYINQYVPGVTTATTTGQVTKNIEKAIKALYDSGIRHFIVPYQADLGDVPIAWILASLTGNGNIPQALSSQTVEHNIKLAGILQNLAATLPYAKFYPVDIYTAVKAVIRPSDIVAGPAAGCLYNIPAPNPAACSAVSFDLGTGLFYWDEIHPTTYVHGIIADAMLEATSQ